MDKKDKDKISDHLNKYLKEEEVCIFRDYKAILPFSPFPLSEEFLKLLNNKFKNILSIYDENDIMFMVDREIISFLDYNELRKNISNNSDIIILVGKLPNLLNESKFIDICNKIIEKIIEKLENPTISYALIPLSNVELSENIKINNDFFLVADIEDYFKIDDNEKESFNFRFENGKTYLLIEQSGYNWQLFEELFEEFVQSLFYKNLMQKIKTFLGLSLVMDIFKFSNTPSLFNKSKEKRNIASTIGIFSSIEWAEDVPWYKDVIREEEDWGNPLPEDHPDYNDLKETYSMGDELRRLCFQKRFFIGNEINLPQTYIDLFNSLTITEFATNPSFSLKKLNLEGEATSKPLHQFEKLERPDQFLNQKFGKIRIILNSKGDDYAERIKASSLWYFEGYCTESDTFKFIDYTIAIESLLGDKNKKEQLTERLSDRCGFLLGESLKEKEKIKKEFEDIYDIRSKIMHSGKVILGKKEKENLNKLENMIKQLIFKTIKTYEPEK